VEKIQRKGNYIANLQERRNILGITSKSIWTEGIYMANPN